MLRYPKDPSKCAFCPAGLEILNNTQELSYLTQVVIRLFSDRSDPTKSRCEIYFTPGATNDPLSDLGKSPLLAPYVLLNKSISYEELCTCLDAAVLAGSERFGNRDDSFDETIHSVGSARSSGDHKLHELKPIVMSAAAPNLDPVDPPTAVGNNKSPESKRIVRSTSSAPLLTINSNYSDNKWELDMSPSLATKPPIHFVQHNHGIPPPAEHTLIRHVSMPKEQISPLNYEHKSPASESTEDKSTPAATPGTSLPNTNSKVKVKLSRKIVSDRD